MKKTPYQWVIVACAFLMLCFTNGLTLQGLAVFDEKLLDAFGWSRGTLKFRDLLTFLIAGCAGPFIGAIADRYGVRKLMAVGLVLLSIGLYCYSLMGNSTHLYLVHVLFGSSLAAAGLVVNILLVSRWFNAKRGTAIGLALIGTSLGNIIFAQVNTQLAESMPWQTAFRYIAILPLLLLPMVIWVIRERPETAGSATAQDSPAALPPNDPGIGYQEALRSVNFWAIALGAMMTFYAILGVSSHLFLHLRGFDFTPQAAAKGIGLLFFFGLIGKGIIGFLSDFFNSKWVYIANLAVMLIGSFFLTTLSVSYYWPFLIFFGLGWGGLYTMIQLLTVESFGLKAAGRILGTITILDALGGGLGPWVTGVLFDQTQSYRLPFTVVTVLIGLALVAALFIRTPKVTPSST